MSGMGDRGTLLAKLIVEAKERLGYRQFGEWLRARGISPRTARRLAQEYRDPSSGDRRRAENRGRMAKTRRKAATHQTATHKAATQKWVLYGRKVRAHIGTAERQALKYKKAPALKARRHAEQVRQHARAAAALLIEAKAALQPGDWEQWLAENSIPERAAQRLIEKYGR